MEIVEILTDIYIALGSAFTSVNERLKNYHKILNICHNGSNITYSYLLSIRDIADTIRHEPKAKILLIDRIQTKGGFANIHCILLDSRCKFVNSLTVKENQSTVPSELYVTPQKWNI